MQVVLTMVVRKQRQTCFIWHEFSFPIIIPRRNTPQRRIHVKHWIRGKEILKEIWWDVKIIWKTKKTSLSPSKPSLTQNHHHTHPDHQTSFINFLHLLQSIASSVFSLRAWQSALTTSLQVLFGLPLCLGPSTSYSILHYYYIRLTASFPGQPG